MPNRQYLNERHSNKYDRRRYHKDKQTRQDKHRSIYERNRSHSTDSLDSRDSYNSHNSRSNNRHYHHHRQNNYNDRRENKYSHRDNGPRRQNNYNDSSHKHKEHNSCSEYKGRGRDEHSISRPRLSRQEQYQRNYAYIIRNIGENLKKGLYKNTEELQEELDELQNDKNHTVPDALFCQQFDDLSSLYKRDELEDNEDETCDDNNSIVDYVQNEINIQRNTIAIDKMLKYGNDNRPLRDDTKNSVRSQFNNIAKTSAIKVGDYMFKAYSHIDISKTYEPDEFAFCLLFSLSNLYKLLGNKEKREYRTQLYRKIVCDFEKNGYYKKFGYKDKRLSRNGLIASMMAQAPLDLLGQTLIMDYFKVNVLVYKSDLQKFLPYIQYKEEYVSIFMKYQHTKFTSIELADTNENNDGFVSPTFIKRLIEEELVNLNEIVNPFTSSVGKLKAYSAYKLPELRDIAESLSIELTKVIGEKDKKKTKRELYDEIKGLYEMNTS
jgi:hypothetical protein